MPLYTSTDAPDLTRIEGNDGVMHELTSSSTDAEVRIALINLAKAKSQKPWGQFGAYYGNQGMEYSMGILAASYQIQRYALCNLIMMDHQYLYRFTYNGQSVAWEGSRVDPFDTSLMEEAVDVIPFFKAHWILCYPDVP